MSEEGIDNWITQLRKGLLELCVLSAIQKTDECYGYELVRRLVQAPGLEISEGSIYPLLSRLRKQGLIKSRLEESQSGPARKYYTLSSLGKARILAMQSYYDSLSEGVETIRSKPS